MLCHPSFVIYTRRYSGARAEEGSRDANLFHEFRGLIEKLNEEFTAVLKQARDVQAGVLGFESNELMADSSTYPSRVWGGELYRSNDELLGITLTAPANAYGGFSSGSVSGAFPSVVDICHISKSPTASKGAERFNSMVSELLHFSLAPVRSFTDRAIAFQKENYEAATQPTEDEINAARLLANRVVRDIAITVKSTNGGMLRAALPGRLAKIDNTDKVITNLVNVGVIEEEHVIVCRKSDSVIVRLSSQDSVEESMRNMRCACGVSLADEQVEQALNVTPFGRTLLDKSHWMTVVLIDELARAGVPCSTVYVEQKDGEDEMDCIAVVKGHLVLFELKDKDFKLGNAYSFAAKMGILRPNQPVVVTTGKVDADARSHFERAHTASRTSYNPEPASPPIYIEGMETLSSALEGLADKYAKADAEAYLKSVLPLAAVYPSSVIRAYTGDTGY